MSSPETLVRFTNCLLPQEDGSLVEKDLWIDETSGIILDAQKAFYMHKERHSRIVDVGGNIVSPGFLDIQINGAYGFDFSIHNHDDEEYRQGLQMVAERIVENGVTSLLPTIITQKKTIYPKLLSLLKPFSTSKSATLLGWHAEGPFIDLTKRGIHEPAYILTAADGFKSFENVYGPENLVTSNDWITPNYVGPTVRLITAAPEVLGVMTALEELVNRGIIFSIGHSIATTEAATAAVQQGARLITHLFNAMPQLHHRDPSIIGLLGASPHLYPPTPVQNGSHPTFTNSIKKEIRYSLHEDNGQTADMAFERPYYGIILDGVHCHPSAVRLAYSSHPEGCILVTDAMSIVDPNLKDGVHEWRDGKRLVKEGQRVLLEGTTTLAGSVVTLDHCVRNLSRFTGCSLGEAIKCATYNPARCLGIENVKGTLRPGAHADLIVVDRQGVVLSTWIRGIKIWSK